MKTSILSSLMVTVGALAALIATSAPATGQGFAPGHWERLGYGQNVFWHSHYNLDTPRYGDRWKLCGADGFMTGIYWNPPAWAFGVGCATDSNVLYGADEVRWQGIQVLDHPRYGDRLAKCDAHERMVGWKYNPTDWALEIACAPAARPQQDETIRDLSYGRLDAPAWGDRFIACAEGESAQGVSMNPKSWGFALICARH